MRLCTADGRRARTQPTALDEFRGLLEMHRDAGSRLARALLTRKGRLGDEVWLIEPVDSVPAGVIDASVEPLAAPATSPARRPMGVAPAHEGQPVRRSIPGIPSSPPSKLMTRSMPCRCMIAT